MVDEDLLVFNQDALAAPSLDEIVVGRDGFTKTRASLGALWTDVRHGRCDMGPDRCLGFLDSLQQEGKTMMSSHAETAAQRMESFLRRKLEDCDISVDETPTTPTTLMTETPSFISPEWQSRLSLLWYGISQLYVREARRLGATIKTKIVQPGSRKLQEWIPRSEYPDRRIAPSSAFPDDESIGPE